jgi:hypothetical protein
MSNTQPIDPREFSEALSKLYQDTKFMSYNTNIIFSYDNNIPRGAAACQRRLPDGSIEISVLSILPKETHEYMLSHELLHAYIEYHGVPRYDIVDDLNVAHSAYGCILHNSVLHVLILHEQKARGFSVDTAHEYIYKEVYNYPNEKDMRQEDKSGYLLFILDMLIFKPDSNELAYIELIQPTLFCFAKRLYNILETCNIGDFFSIRRTSIRMFKEFDFILEELSLGPMHLCTYISLSFIPRERQLNLKMKQMFYIQEVLNEKGSKVLVLCTISEKQATYIFRRSLEKVPDYMDMTLIEFYQKVMDLSVFCRDSRTWHNAD